MKYFFSLLITLFISAPVFSLPPNTTQVDLKSYAGRWYEIASIPMFFQRGCSCTQATYSLRDDDKVHVVNACIREGKPVKATAKAWSVSPNNHELRVRFFWPFTASYTIVYVDPGYRYAIVSNRQKSYLWILARQPHISSKVYADLVDYAAKSGYRTPSLLITDQQCDIKQRSKLQMQQSI